LALLFGPNDGGDTFRQNAGCLLQDYMALFPEDSFKSVLICYVKIVFHVNDIVA
jgi:hypothetical protein